MPHSTTLPKLRTWKSFFAQKTRRSRRCTTWGLGMGLVILASSVSVRSHTALEFRIVQILTVSYFWNIFFFKFLFWLFGSSRGPLFLPRPHFLPPSLPPSYSFFLLPPPFRSVPHISLPRSSSSLLLLPFLPNVLPKHKGEGGKGRCVAKVRNPNKIRIIFLEKIIGKDRRKKRK